MYAEVTSRPKSISVHTPQTHVPFVVNLPQPIIHISGSALAYSTSNIVRVSKHNLVVVVSV